MRRLLAYPTLEGGFDIGIVASVALELILLVREQGLLFRRVDVDTTMPG